MSNTKIDIDKKDLNKDINIIDIEESTNKLRSLMETSIDLDEETVAAKEIAEKLKDLQGINYYRSIIGKVGLEIARKILSDTLDDMHRAEEYRKIIRKPGAIYNWKITNYLLKKRRV